MESLKDWVDKVNFSEKLIITEGKKDVKALRNSGVTNRIKTLSKQPLFSVAEEVSGEEVIILTDFDKKGKELYGRLKRELQGQGVKVDNVFREWLQNNTKLSHIEGFSI